MTCPCQTDVEEPGPHIDTCPYSDPNYDPDPFGIAELEREKRANPCHRAPDFEVFVPGVPRPQGSKTRNANGSMRESSKYVKAWRLAVMANSVPLYHQKVCTQHLIAFCKWCDRAGATPPLDGPLALGVEFLFKRPAKGHTRDCVACSGKGWLPLAALVGCSVCGGSKKVLRADAPVYFTGAPDLDKLHRAIQDSLEAAGVCRNDSQFVRYHEPVKRYANPGEQPGARIRVWRLT